jgi:predicted HicB family RNase H-like nuclease
MKTDVNGFLGSISDWSDGVLSLYKEVNEVQTAFNTRLVDLDSELKKQLELATSDMKSTYDTISPSAKKAFDSKVTLAKADLDKIIAELRAAIKKADTKAKEIEKKNVDSKDGLQKINPELNDKEEALKVQIDMLAAECKALSKQLSKYDGIRGWFAGASVANLRKEFTTKMKKLETMSQEINFVRKTWSDKLTTTEKAESTERTEWMAIQKEISTNSMELANIEKNYEALSFQNAITALTKESIPEGFSPKSDAALKKIKELRASKDELVEGLIQISGTLATLKGINDGFAAFAKSVAKLKEEQDTYSSLTKLHFEIADAVIAYNEGFTSVIPSIKDEKKMAQNPKEYSTIVKTKLDANLKDSNIEAMFNTLGKSIEVATKAWK